MKEKRVRSWVPPIVSAVVLLAWAVALPMYRGWHMLLAAAVSAAIGIAAGKLFKGKNFQIEMPQCAENEPAGREDQVKLAVLKGREQIKDLRRLNSLIDDEKISSQIDEMENIAGRIFDYVELHPEKFKQIRRFADYYMPTSLKLLRTYDDLSCQGIVGSNISGTMRSIEEAMDTIVIAYKKQLDGLFADKAMDISTDITVLEGLLAAEGINNKQGR